MSFGSMSLPAQTRITRHRRHQGVEGSDDSALLRPVLLQLRILKSTQRSLSICIQYKHYLKHPNTTWQLSCGTTMWIKTWSIVPKIFRRLVWQIFSPLHLRRLARVGTVEPPQD